MKFSLKNNLGLHTSFGGKYAELWVTYELWPHEPKVGHERCTVKDIENPYSCDVVLAKTKKKLEIKWGMLHYRSDDPYMKGANGILFWNWGFSTGKQFMEKKFDYCILLAAEKDGAGPQHIFVIKIDEMNKETFGSERKSAVYNKGSYYIEYSEDKNFYSKKKVSY